MKRLFTLCLFAVVVAAQGQNFSLDFDGTDDIVNVGDSTLLEMDSALTMEAWIYPKGYSGIANMIMNKEGEYEIGIMSNELRWSFANTTPGWGWNGTGYNMPLNTWTHFAIVFKIDSILSYVNGTQVDAISASGIIVDTQVSYNNFIVGWRQQVVTNNNPFNGNIDEVRLWNVARTAGEISSSWNSELTGNESGLMLYYKMDEVASPNDVEDCSPNQLHGTRQGAIGNNNLPQYLTTVPSITDVLCGGVSINEIDLEASFSMFPNPSSGSFTVQGATGNIEVLDLFGRIVLTTTLPQIDMRGYAKGVYFVRVGEVVRKLVLN